MKMVVRGEVALVLAGVLVLLMVGSVLASDLVYQGRRDSVRVGRVDAVPAETPLRVQLAKDVIYLVRDGDAIVVLRARLESGCDVVWEAGMARFIDPCHGSQYTREGGYMFGPDCCDLGRYPSTIRGNEIWINTNPLRLIPGGQHR